MATTQKPHILVIDDRPEDLPALGLLVGEMLRVLHPEDITDDDLRTANLILIDYDLAYWPNRDKVTSICLQPLDGLALAAVLRSQIKRLQISAPVSFAIYTGELQALARPLPPENREHALSDLVNVDWIFQKSSDPQTLVGQILSLGEAVVGLPERWSADGAMLQLAELLGISFADSANQQYLRDLEDCLPPIHEISEWSHGISIVRWLLHRIFPFPTFLINENFLAARFRISHKALVANLSPGEALHNALEKYSYIGVLSAFSSRRWWRSGIENFLWEITNGNSGDFATVHQALESITGAQIEPSEPPDFPVIVLDENYRESESFVSEEDAVRIRPDYYPSYADQPWVAKALARENEKMRSLVLREDLENLK